MRARAGAVALAVYLALAFGLFASAWRDPFVYGIGDRGDPSQFQWFLTWFPFATGHGLGPFLTNFADYPAGANLLWNTSVPLASYVLWPVTALLGPLFAYDLMVTLALALSAWSAFVLLRRLVRSPFAASVGGLLYGFSPYMVAEAHGHPHLVLAFLPPLILLVVDEIVRVQRRRPVVLGAALALLCVAQFFLSEEVLAMTGLTTAVLLVVAAALWPAEVRARAPYAAKALLLAGGLFAAAVAWPAGYQFLGPQHVSGPLHEPNVYVNDLLGFLVPGPLQWLAPGPALGISSRFSGNPGEWTAYLGLPLTLLLGFVAVRHWQSGWVRLAAMAGAVVAILSLGITLHVGGATRPWLLVGAVGLGFLALPWVPGRVLALLTAACWLALWRLPVLDSLLPSRLMLLVYLLAGAALAIFIDGLASRGWRHLALGTAAVAVALAPLMPRLPYPSVDFEVPAFFAQSGAVARMPQGSVALVAPVTTYHDVDAMLWQADAGMRFRMPEAYLFVPAPGGSTVNTPAGATADALVGVELGTPAPVDDTAIRSELAAWHVRTVVVGPMPNRDQAVALLTEVLGRPPEVEGGVSVWWDVDT